MVSGPKNGFWKPLDERCGCTEASLLESTAQRLLESKTIQCIAAGTKAQHALSVVFRPYRIRAFCNANWWSVAIIATMGLHSGPSCLMTTHHHKRACSRYW
jgi:hypothetical protein